MKKMVLFVVIGFCIIVIGLVILEDQVKGERMDFPESMELQDNDSPDDKVVQGVLTHQEYYGDEAEDVAGGDPKPITSQVYTAVEE